MSTGWRTLRRGDERDFTILSHPRGPGRGPGRAASTRGSIISAPDWVHVLALTVDGRGGARPPVPGRNSRRHPRVPGRHGGPGETPRTPPRPASSRRRPASSPRGWTSLGACYPNPPSKRTACTPSSRMTVAGQRERRPRPGRGHPGRAGPGRVPPRARGPPGRSPTAWSSPRCSRPPSVACSRERRARAGAVAHHDPRGGPRAPGSDDLRERPGHLPDRSGRRARATRSGWPGCG